MSDLNRGIRRRIDALERVSGDEPTIFYWEGGRMDALKNYRAHHPDDRRPDAEFKFLEFRWIGEAGAR